VTAGGIALRVAETGRADLEIRLPPVNVLGVADLEAIAAAVARVARSRVLVLSGLPRAFSAGVSVAEHVPEAASIERMLSAMRRALEALLDAPAVTVAAVSGACLGGGAEIAAACDLVLCAADARVGFPEIRLACFPPGAAALLPGRVGESRAADWILTGRIVSGREAAEAGFATRAVAPDALAGETDRLAAQLLSQGAAALSAARELARAGRRQALAATLPRAEEAYRALAGDADLARAVREFPEGKARRA
jgi:cyclohexa-1,5-dienecarbonyl-CoA hydratase